MKVLLTGASGYIGQKVIEMLQHQATLRLFGRRPMERDVQFIQGDIREYRDVEKAVHGVDTIVHMAAYAPEKKKECDNLSFFDVNVKGTLNILETAVKAKVKKVVYASSVCAVGYENQHLPVKETTLPLPSDGMYGLSKRMGEQLCEHYSKEFKISTLCLRFATVFPLHKIIPDTDTPFWFGYVDVRDAIQAIELAVHKENLTHEIFHVCAKNSATRYDITLAKTKLGFSPKHNFEEHMGRPERKKRRFNFFKFRM